MKYITIIALFFSLLIADNNYCTLPYIDNHPIISSSRSLYDIGDTISEEDQSYQYSVCHSDGNYDIGSTFLFSDYSGDIILISMNATW